jgi:predicted RNA methylase
VRDRDREFAEAARPSKEQVLQNFDRAIDLVAETVRKQSAEDWNKEYSADGVTAKNRFAIVLDCAAHADHHVGQIINLSRELSRASSAQSPSA